MKEREESRSCAPSDNGAPGEFVVTDICGICLFPLDACICFDGVKIAESTSASADARPSGEQK